MNRQKKDETIIINGKIWISGSENDFKWFSFHNSTGRITGIGQDNQAADVYGDIVDAQNCWIFPGFHDAHIHVSNFGMSLMSANLKACSSICELQDRLGQFVKTHTKQLWVIGRGWEQDLLGREPDKQDLDAVCSDRPVRLSRTCGHIMVVNSRALQMAGITKDTEDPEGGVIERYPPGHPCEGEPTGILKEDPALKLVIDIWQVTKEEKKGWLQAGLLQCLKNGITSVQSNESMWKEYCELVDENKLPIRVFMTSYLLDRDVSNFPEYPCQKYGPLLSCDRLKILVDGSLGACTAVLSTNYPTDSNNYGVMIHTQEKLNDLVQSANSEGYRLEVHVIGDRAADAVLSALEKARVSPEKRPVLTHCQILRADLIERMVKLKVIANIQPQFVTTDARWVPQLLPPDLLKYCYPWKTLLHKGIVCAGGSDAPVESPEPFLGIYDAIFRPNGERKADKQDTFRPEECLTVTEAIDCYTKAAAYTCMREHDLGQLLPGYMADFVILDHSQTEDPVHNPKHFLTAKAKEVWVAGKRML